jgi:hypothetical protein
MKGLIFLWIHVKQCSKEEKDCFYNAKNGKKKKKYCCSVGPKYICLRFIIKVILPNNKNQNLIAHCDIFDNKLYTVLRVVFIFCL